MTMNIKNTLKAVLFSLVVLLVPSFVSAQTGTALTSTTTSAIISSNQVSFQVASVTGISGFGAGINSPTGGTVANGNLTDLYIDRELMQVVSVNTTSKTVVVIRGQGGSQASAHKSGAIVIIGVPSAFIDYDPEGYCGSITAPGTNQNYGNPPTYSPWINQRTSSQWICSTVSTTWVPGYGNPGVSGTQADSTTAVASATSITPTGALFHVTGTTAVVTIALPATYAGGPVTIIFDGVDTWTAAGNIAVAGTNTTAGSSVTFVYSFVTSKWYPSRLA
jgi:hypothetical protein